MFGGRVGRDESQPAHPAVRRARRAPRGFVVGPDRRPGARGVRAGAQAFPRAVAARWHGRWSLTFFGLAAGCLAASAAPGSAGGAAAFFLLASCNAGIGWVEAAAWLRARGRAAR